MKSCSLTPEYYDFTSQKLEIFNVRNYVACNIYTVQQDTQSVLMSEFIHHVC